METPLGAQTYTFATTIHLGVCVIQAGLTTFEGMHTKESKYVKREIKGKKTAKWA